MWLLLAAACSSTSSDDGSDDRSASSTSSSTAIPSDPGSSTTESDRPGGGERPGLDDPATAELLAALEGQLAIGNGPAVAVARPDGQALRVLAVDGETAAQPTWSHDGTALAWSSTSPRRQVVLTQSFDDEGVPDGQPAVSEATGFPVFYLQWAADDRAMAYLRSGDQRGQVEFGLVEPGQPIEPRGQDTPFFVAWSPGPARVLAHVAQSRVEIHDADAPGGEPTIVVDQGADYSAPAWIDQDRALVVVDGALAVVDVTDSTIEPLEPLDGPVRFVASPDGRRVAYRLVGQPEEGTLQASWPVASREPAGTVLTVIDLESGEREVVGDGTAAAWEWSPDGSRLAWLSVEADVRLVGQWSFWSVDGDELPVGGTPEFGLSRKYAQIYLPFFAQYAQSITGWAPDGSAFAFAGALDDDRGIWVQLLEATARPQLVSAGDMVTWGPGPTPEPEAGPSAA